MALKPEFDPHPAEVTRQSGHPFALRCGLRRYHVSDAALHDSQAVDHLLMRGNTGSGI